MLACRNGRLDSLTIRAGANDPVAGREGPAKVTVEDGIVTLRGQVPRRLLTHPLIEGVRRTAGVIAVHDHLTYAVDDSVLPPRQPLP